MPKIREAIVQVLCIMAVVSCGSSSPLSLSDPSVQNSSAYCMVITKSDNDTIYIGTKLLPVEHLKSIDGVYVYYMNGSKYIEEHCEDGKRNGPFTIYYPSGQIKARGYNVHGSRRGYYIQYTEAGETAHIEFYP
jgi:hypothetical protein